MRPLVMVPAYNEEVCLPQTLAELAREAPGLDVIVVDDGSRDRTKEVARAAGYRVLSLPINLGVGGALQTGVRYAIEHGEHHEGGDQGGDQLGPGHAADPSLPGARQQAMSEASSVLYG